MKQLNKFVKVVAKICEIVHWVGAAFMAVMAICTAAAPQWLKYFVDLYGAEGGLSIYGFEVVFTDTAAAQNKTLGLFAIGGVILFGLVAMIFRNIYLIIKKSENSTPFQKDNVRMVREIGIFSIAIPIIGLIMGTVIRLAVGVDAIETSVNLDGVLMGIVVLCLTQIFAYGVALEKDVDGLL